MSLPASMIVVCSMATPDQACDGPPGAQIVPIAQTLASSWVYAGAGPTDCTSRGMVQVSLLPAGSYVYVFDQALNVPAGGTCQPASNFAFGLGAAFTPPFDVTQLDGTQLASAFAAGFVLVGTAFAMGKAIGTLLRFFFV